MNQSEWDEFIDTVKANVRSHAGYFSWLRDRDVEEMGVVQTLAESLAHRGQSFFHAYGSRGRGNDPPDCEAQSCTNGRIGIEVTELVDRNSLKAAKAGDTFPWEPFSESELFELLAKRIAKKDNPQEVIGGPYDEYVLIIYCDEPRVVDYRLIESMQGATFPRTTLIDRTFLLFSFDAWQGYCPYLELNLNGG